MYIPRFLHIGTNWKWVVRFIPPAAFARCKDHPKPSEMCLGGLQNFPRWSGKDKILDYTGTRTPTPMSFNPIISFICYKKVNALPILTQMRVRHFLSKNNLTLSYSPPHLFRSDSVTNWGGTRLHYKFTFHPAYAPCLLNQESREGGGGQKDITLYLFNSRSPPPPPIYWSHVLQDFNTENKKWCNVVRAEEPDWYRTGIVFRQLKTA
jgi:hypothetical protein